MKWSHTTDWCRMMLEMWRLITNFILPSEEGITIPPILAYADLILQGDPRNQETAQKIYDKYLQNQFGPARL